MIARSPIAALSAAALLLGAAPALAQDLPPPPAAPPAPACTVIIVVPGAQPVPATPSCAPQPLPPAPYVAPPQPLPPGSWDPPQWAYVQPAPRTRSIFSAKLWAGPAYQRLYDLDIWGADFGVSLGAQRGISGWYAELRGVVGKTVHGLPVYEYWIGPTWEAKLDRVHLGLGFDLGWTGIGRATPGPLITGLGFGIFGFASVDLYRSDEGHALYVSGRITSHFIDGGDATAIQVGPSAALGWRY